MKNPEALDQVLKVIRAAVTKIGYREASRSLRRHHMAAFRFCKGEHPVNAIDLFRFAAIAGYDLKLVAQQSLLPFATTKKKGRHKPVTARARAEAKSAIALAQANRPVHLSRKDMLMVGKAIGKKRHTKVPSVQGGFSLHM